MEPEFTKRPEFTRRPEFLLEANRQKRNSPSLILELLIFFLVYMIGSSISGVIAAVPMLGWLYSGERLRALMQADPLSGELLNTLFSLLKDTPTWMNLVLIVVNFVLGVVAVLFCRIIEKRSLSTMGLVRKGAVRSYLLGALLGALCFTAVVGLAACFKGVRIQSLQFRVELLPMLLLYLVVFVLQSAGEELLVRGYLMVSLTKRGRLAFSIALSSVVFGMLHVANIGMHPIAFLNIALVGVALGLYVLKTGNLWGACGFHALWNFFQGNVFGLPVSGLDAGDSVFAVEVTGHSDLLTGGAFGLEGSLCTTVVMLAAVGVLIWLLRKNAPDEPEAPAETE